MLTLTECSAKSIGLTGSNEGLIYHGLDTEALQVQQ